MQTRDDSTTPLSPLHKQLCQATTRWGWCAVIPCLRLCTTAIPTSLLHLLHCDNPHKVLLLSSFARQLWYENIHECPVYETRTRGPTFVWTFNLKTKEKAAKWAIAGVCLLLSVWQNRTVHTVHTIVLAVVTTCITTNTVSLVHVSCNKDFNSWDQPTEQVLLPKAIRIR